MEGREKEQCQQASDFTDADHSTFVWARCQQTCINGTVERIRQIPEGHTCHISIELQSDILIPKDARPVIDWREDRGKWSIRRERIFICVVTSGIDHWKILSDGVYSFLRGVANGIATSVEGYEFNFTEIIEGRTIAKCRLNVHRPTPPSLEGIVDIYASGLTPL